MPDDPSGVTTDAHGSGDGAGRERGTPPEPADDGPIGDARAGLPPVRRVRDGAGNGSDAQQEAEEASPLTADEAEPDEPSRSATEPSWAVTEPAAPVTVPDADDSPHPRAPADHDTGDVVRVDQPEPEAAPARRLRRARPQRVKSKPRTGLRVRQRLWTIDPWSVFKLSFLFYVCLCGILLVAGTLLWNVGRSVGTIDQVESFVTRLGAYGTCTARAEVPAGVDFETDDDCAEGEVLVGGYQLDDGTIFRMIAIGGGILVGAGSIGNVLMVVLLNLLNELTGGLRHTIVKEPIRGPPGGRPRGGRRVGRRRAPPHAGAERHRGTGPPGSSEPPVSPPTDGDGQDAEDPTPAWATGGSADRGSWP